MRLIFTVAAAAMLTACMPPVNRSGAIPLTVMQVDLDRYVGKWFEIARFPNQFEKNCEGVTAEYAAQPDGKITVTNTCRVGAPDGKARVAEGVARIVDPATNAKLKVKFFGPFEGDYWVLDHAEDYSWSIVGEPRGRYLWVLSRAPEVSDGLRADLLKRLEDRGYNTSALTWTKQPPA